MLVIEGGGSGLPPGIDYSIHRDEPQQATATADETAAIPTEPTTGTELTPFERRWMAARGFLGFQTFSDLLQQHLSSVPSGWGIYVVVRESAARPKFRDTGSGGHFKGRNPNVDVTVLDAKWVTSAHVLYIGKATDLRTRLRQYARFGTGIPIGHWGGRYIWQIEDPTDLLVAWKTTERNPREEEIELVLEFEHRFGVPPFANLVH